MFTMYERHNLLQECCMHLMYLTKEFQKLSSEVLRAYAGSNILSRESCIKDTSKEEKERRKP